MASLPKGDVQVATFANKYDSGLGLLLDSARRNAIHVNILGFGDPRLDNEMHTFAEKGGWRMRLHAYKEFAETRPDPKTIVVFVDAYDVVFSGGPSDIEAGFRKALALHPEARVVFSGEKACAATNCHPKKGVVVGPSGSPLKNLCAGVIVATAGGFLSAIENNPPPETGAFDDQAHWGKAWARDPSIVVDGGAFISTNPSARTDVLRFHRNGAIVEDSDLPGSKPAIVHFSSVDGKMQLERRYTDMYPNKSTVLDREGEKFAIIAGVSAAALALLVALVIVSVLFGLYREGKVKLPPVPGAKTTTPTTQIAHSVSNAHA